MSCFFICKCGSPHCGCVNASILSMGLEWDASSIPVQDEVKFPPLAMVVVYSFGGISSGFPSRNSVGDYPAKAGGFCSSAG